MKKSKMDRRYWITRASEKNNFYSDHRKRSFMNSFLFWSNFVVFGAVEYLVSRISQERRLNESYDSRRYCIKCYCIKCYKRINRVVKTQNKSAVFSMMSSTKALDGIHFLYNF